MKMSLQPQHKRYSAAPYFALALLWLLTGLAACSTPQETEPDVMEVVTPTQGNVQTIVTRIVETFTTVTTTPGAAQEVVEQTEPVALDLALVGSLPNLDPHVATGQDELDLAENLFIGLTRLNPSTGEIEPALATEWQVGPDARTWTFSLRDDVNWVRPVAPPPGRDGPWTAERVRPVTADDVAFAIQRTCSREVESPFAYTLFIIDGCEKVFGSLQPTEADIEGIGARAVDDTTLEILLTKPAAYFLTLTSQPLFRPVPRELVTELGTEWQDVTGDMGSGWQTPQNLVTSGPYMLLPGLATSDRVVLQSNPEWPLDKLGNVDTVNMALLDNEDDAFELWQSRTLDMVSLPESSRQTLMERTPGKVRVVPDQVLFYMGFNFDSPVLREPEIRRALSAAIDREALVEEIFGGRALGMRHATVPGVFAAVPVNEVGVGYSPDFARQQMNNSSYRSCRLMPPITLLVSSADLSLRQAELIRDMWVEELDCLQENINIEQAQFGALLASTRSDAGSARPDMWELAWAPSFPDAHGVLSDLLQCSDSENRQNRPCEEADTLLRRAASTLDDAGRIDLYRRVESHFFGESGIFPIAPLYVQADEWAVQDWVTIQPAISGGQQWDRIVLDVTTKELERSR